ncbi:hypothetical protein JHK87_009266 [Glycine soja]|nr:hypothetical protein JHK87_009266 [Glycine soja]
MAGEKLWVVATTRRTRRLEEAEINCVRVKERRWMSSTNCQTCEASGESFESESSSNEGTGMHAWFAAVADTRYTVVVLLIDVQVALNDSGFQWAIDNDKCQGRVDSIKPLFEVARDHLGKVAIDKEVARKVWDRIAPGLASQFNSPYSIPTIAPHPLLILNGAEDPRCPLGGLEIPRAKATKAYRKFHCLDNFRVYPLKLDEIKLDGVFGWEFFLEYVWNEFIAEAGIGHQVTRFMIKESADWFDRFLNP